jgi:ferritin-like metal-binding protein YciE
MSVESLQDALVEELRDILHAEKQILKALPKMARAAENQELREAFENHLAETQEHQSRLEQALVVLGKPVRPKPCKGMKGIIEENTEQMEEAETGPVLDALLIAGAQKVEHYEIASYGTVIAWAEQLGQGKIVKILTKTLNEEKAADEKLSEIAETINASAESAKEGEVEV